MAAPVDIPRTDIVRRQGDVSGTLLYIAPNGQPANIGGWNFTFSCQPGPTLLTVQWTPPSGNSTGAAMTTISGSGFIWPGNNSTVVVPVLSSAGIIAGDYLYFPNFGVVACKSVMTGSSILIYNNGFPNNTQGGFTVDPASPLYEASNMGYTVLVIPSTITDWNSSAPVTPMRSAVQTPYYIRYDTTDPAPGPYKKTCAWGMMYIVSQNDPTS